MRKAEVMLTLALLLTLFFVAVLVASPATAVNITVAYGSPVATGDLDGNPGTGTWSDATQVVVPLENGEPDPYGSVTGYFKHDGTYLYVRLDGKIDVPWTSASGDHFWLGFMISPAATMGHHKAGQDLIFFGETAYGGVTYPLTPQDAYGGGKPPPLDTQQDATGMLKFSGSSAPYSFTAEWKKKLSTGDSQDIVLTPDGSTTYNFYISTDSNGGGSSGGKIDHSVVTNTNTMKFAPPDVTPPTVSITSPADSGVVTGTVNIQATASDNVGVVKVQFLVDGTVILDDTSPPYGTTWDSTTKSDGPHILSAKAFDAAGLSAIDQVTVTADNEPPIADAGPPLNSIPGAVVEFNGSGSFDAAGISNYTWNFTDGGPVFLFGPVVTYVFNTEGSYVITLTVKDLVGRSSQDVTWVNVSVDTSAPVANAGPDQQVLQGSMVRLDGSLSWDDVRIATFEWTWYDDTQVILTGMSLTYRFVNVGNFEVSLLVTDLAGNTDQDSLWVNVSADTIAPTAIAGDDVTIDLGTYVILDGAASHDNVEIKDYVWTFEDGTPIVMRGSVINYTFKTTGAHWINLTVTDYAGLTSTDSLIVTVVGPDLTPPGAPQGLTVYSTIPLQMVLNWIPSNENDLAGYNVYRSDSPEGPWIRLNLRPLNSTTYIDIGLQSGRTYYYVVTALDQAGNESPHSMVGFATPLDLPAPPFDLASLQWVLSPAFGIFVFVLFAFLLWRETKLWSEEGGGRRFEGGKT